MSMRMVFIKIMNMCCRLQGSQNQEELIGLNDEERHEFLESYGVKKSGLQKVIRISFHTLGLISFFTGGPKEVHAWTIHKGEKAPRAAGEKNTDFEKGFIRAEV